MPRPPAASPAPATPAGTSSELACPHPLGDSDPPGNPGRFTAAVHALIDSWELPIDALVAAAQGDTDTAAALDPLLTQLTTDSAALVAVLRRIIAGERGQDLLIGLNKVDTAITGRVLDALAEPTQPDQHPEDTHD